MVARGVNFLDVIWEGARTPSPPSKRERANTYTLRCGNAKTTPVVGAAQNAGRD